MADHPKKLGKLVSIHGVSPVHMQRAAIVAVLSFIFFLAMLVVFSFRQQIGYFVLASAFMVVEIFTLIGIFVQRRTLLKIFENGLSYKKQNCSWLEITGIKKEKGYEIVCLDSKVIALPETIYEIDKVIGYITAQRGIGREKSPH